MKSILAIAVLLSLLALSARTPWAETFQVEARDGVLLSGSYTPAQKGKPTVVLVHEMGKSSAAFGDFAPKLLGKGFGVLTFDQRGHGASTRTNRGGYLEQDDMDYSAQARMMESDLETVIGHYKNQTGAQDGDLCLMGAGVGANVAANYAANHPGTGGLVLLSMSKNRSGVVANDSMDVLAERNQNMLLVYSSKESNRVENTSRVSYQKAGDEEGKKKRSASADQPVGMIRQYGRGTGSGLLNGKNDDDIVNWIDNYGSLKKEDEQQDAGKQPRVPEAEVIPPAGEQAPEAVIIPPAE